MQEAALRHAAGDPNGRQRLQLPNMIEAERLPDPKAILYEILRGASGLHGRRRRNLKVELLASRVATSIDDISPLRQLQAFRELEAGVERMVKEQG